MINRPLYNCTLNYNKIITVNIKLQPLDNGMDRSTFYLNMFYILVFIYLVGDHRFTVWAFTECAHRVIRGFHSWKQTEMTGKLAAGKTASRILLLPVNVLFFLSFFLQQEVGLLGAKKKKHKFTVYFRDRKSVV